jgi:carbamoyl-phosphate synthase large subunit
VDASPWAPSLYQSDVYDRTYRIPRADDNDYWSETESLVANENIDFAFIVPETEILVWAKRALTHSLPCPIHIPDWKLADFCFDKSRVAGLLSAKGLAPKTVTVDVKSVLEEAGVGIDYPYWIRVKSGAGALGALKVNSKKDLVTWLSIHSNRNDFIASEFLPGRIYACKLLYKSGELVQSASAERIDYLLSEAAPSGISGMCERGRLLNRPDLVSVSKEALETISLHLNIPLNGMFTVDFKEGNSGIPLITEINIRHVSFNEAFTLGGVNFAETTLRMLFEEGFQKCPDQKFTSEDYFIRGVDVPLRLVSKEELRRIGKL